MEIEEYFTHEIGKDLEESIRIDRQKDEELGSENHALETYHVTEKSKEFLIDFFQNLRSESSKKKRKGSNHWLYGYYGSGKSHLLSVLSYLADSEFIRRHDHQKIWNSLEGENNSGLEDFKQEWEKANEDYNLVPVSINLLKYQDKEDMSLSKILIKEMFDHRDMSKDLDVAFFEKWYKKEGNWKNRDKKVKEILKDEGIPNYEKYDWDDVREYKVIAEVVLPNLIKQEIGIEESLKDLKPSGIDTSRAVYELEEWRNEIEESNDKPTKIVVLMDEVTLFVGDNFDRLTELNSLAEKIDEIGKGNIQLVATAQESIEEVQSEYAARVPAFSIAKDRFPHRYSLPSRHVSEIVKNRFLEKTEKGKEVIKEEILPDSSDPQNTFIFTGIGQDTVPSLNSFSKKEIIDYYPFLPYSTSLYMEILRNMREEASDSAKSIFSGTARALLAITNGLLEGWLKGIDRNKLINLVNFYDQIEAEIEDTHPKEKKVIEEISQKVNEGELKEIDLDVAKVLFLLRKVPSFIPLEEGNAEMNLAVGLMYDLQGPSRVKVSGKVGDSIERMEQFIKKEDEGGYRFTDPEERDIYERTKRYKENPDWDSIVSHVDKYLWEDIIEKLNLPLKIDFKGGDKYQVLYNFLISDIELETQFGESAGLEIPINIKGFDSDDFQAKKGGVLVKIEKEGRSELRDRIIDWWALSKGSEEMKKPPEVQDDLTKRKEQVIKGLKQSIEKSDLKVREKEFKSFEKAVKEAVNQKYPDHYHPLMNEINRRNLRELRDLSITHDLPDWGEKIEVPTEDQSTHGGKIQNKVRSVVGKRIKQHGDTSIDRLLDILKEEEPQYEGCEEALAAVIWGLCSGRKDFRPIDEERAPKENEDVLKPEIWNKIRLTEATGGTTLQTLLEENGFLETTETVDKGIVKLRDSNEQISKIIEDVRTDVELHKEDLETSELVDLLSYLLNHLDTLESRAKQRKDRIDSDSPDWDNIIEITKEEKEKVQDIRDRFSNKVKYILRLELLFKIVDRDWIGGDTWKIAEDIRENLKDAQSLNWWSEDGWQRFVDLIGSETKLIDKIDEEWSSYCEENKLNLIAEKVDKMDWLLYSERYPQVLDGFHKKMIKPLKHFYEKFNDLNDIIKTVTGDSSSLKNTDIQRSIFSVDDIGLEDVDFEDLNDKVERLERMVGDSVDKWEIVGLWDYDRDKIRNYIEDKGRTGEIELKKSDEEGVVIK